MQAEALNEAEQSARRELERHAFGQRYAPTEPKNDAVLALYDHLADAPLAKTLGERVEWLEAFCRWILDGPELPSDEGITVREDERTLRLRRVVHVLRAEPEMRLAFVAAIRAVLLESSGLKLFAATGMPVERGFLYEAIERTFRKVLPAPLDHRDLASLLLRVFHRESHAEWLAQAELALLAEFVSTLIDSAETGTNPFLPVREAMLDAITIVSQRVAALGIADDVRARSPDVALKHQPFLHLNRAFTRVVDELRTPGSPHLAAANTDCHTALKSCRRFVRSVFRHLDRAGVSVDLVYRMEMISKGLERLETLLRLLETPTTVFADSVQFLSAIILDGHREHSLLSLVRTNSRRLARKVIERNGTSGEHYITSSRAEWFAMLYSAGGGGVLTAFTAALKYAVLWMQAPRFFEGLFLSLNYAGSFLLMQVVGFTLATKQPSMTAAALAAMLEQSVQGGKTHLKKLNALVELIARIVRSQLAAAIGNVTMVIPSALLLNYAVLKITGHHYLTHETSQHVLQSLNPLGSGCLPLAALTGVFLWLSSLAGGWLENWAVFRRLPEAIAEQRLLRRIFGAERTVRYADILSRNISSAGGSIALGTLLGMAPAIGSFIGLPLEARHVTLSTGSLTLATCSLGWQAARDGGFLKACVGILCILILNFGVSFALALIVALRAREVTAGEQLRLGRATFSRLIHAPLDFIFPPRQAQPIPSPLLDEGDAE